MKLYYRGIRGLVGLLVQKELMDFRLVLFFLFFFLWARNWANFFVANIFFKKMLFLNKVLRQQ